MRRQLLHLAVPIICIAGICAVISAYSAERKLSRGVILLNQNRLPQARSVLETVWTIEPSQLARLHLYLGQTFAGLENYTGALAQLEEGLSTIQSDKYYFLMGKMYARTLKYNEAIKAYRKSCDYNPLFSAPRDALADIYLDRARESLENRDYEAARNFVKQSFRYAPLRKDIFMLAGRIEMTGNDTEQAAHWFEQGLRFHPGDYELNLQLLAADMQLHQYDRAMDIIRALYLCPDPKVCDVLITHLFSLIYEPVQEPFPHVFLAYLLFERNNAKMACNLMQDIDTTESSPVILANKLRCGDNNMEPEELCGVVTQSVGMKSLYSGFLKIFRDRCGFEIADRSQPGEPSQRLYRPLLYGNTGYSMVLLGYSLPDVLYGNSERLNLELVLMSVADNGEIPELRFKLEKPEKHILITPEEPVKLPVSQWHAYETRTISCAILIPGTFKHDNFSVSVSFASPEIRKLYGKEQADVGFVPLFRTVHAGHNIIIEPVTGDM